MQECFFYIIEDVHNTDGEGMKSPIRIFEVPKSFPYLTQGEGPFNSLRGLKRNSLIYKKLKSNNPRLAQKVEKNIVKPIDFIPVPYGATYKMDFIEMFIHATKGHIKKGKVQGLHFYDPDRVEIINEEVLDNSTGVWKAEVKFYDKKNDRWITKENPSTFFPKNWTRTQLFHECNYAYDKMKKKDGSRHIYISETYSKIPVEIIMKNEKLVSIYPIVNHINS